MKRNKTDEIKYCPDCRKEQQTTCCACGCGECVICGHKWSCFGSTALPPQSSPNENKIIHKNCPHCGGKPKEEQMRGSFGGYNQKTIYCQGCASTSPNWKVWDSRTFFFLNEKRVFNMKNDLPKTNKKLPNKIQRFVNKI